MFQVVGCSPSSTEIEHGYRPQPQRTSSNCERHSRTDNNNIIGSFTVRKFMKAPDLIQES